NTILIGEILPELAEFQLFPSGTWAWAGYNNVAQGQTIQPINWRIDPIPGLPAYNANCPATCGSTPFDHCLINWAVTWGFKSKHSGGANFAFADGSIHFINQSIDHKTYQYLGCRNDNQPASIP